MGETGAVMGAKKKRQTIASIICRQRHGGVTGSV